MTHRRQSCLDVRRPRSVPNVIYLDNHSTTPCDPRVVEAMVPYLTTHFGNPHSDSHGMGRNAASAMRQGIESIATILNAPAEMILVTSGATESINLAMRGVLEHPRCRHRRIVTCATEHPATLDVAQRLHDQGVDVHRLPVDTEGRLNPDSLREALRTPTALVTLLWANNETGMIHPINEIAAIVHEFGSILHCDATQAVGRIPVDMKADDVDLLTASAHKFHGPKGVGILVVGNGQRRIRLTGQIIGGGQQNGLRSGTMNPAAVIAMSTALRLAIDTLGEDATHIRFLRDHLWDRLRESIDGLELNGPPLSSVERLAGNLNFRLPDVEGETWMSAAPGVAFSSGSACSSTEPAPSHVLTAMGLSEAQARRSVRFGVGRDNDQTQIETAAEILIDAYGRVRPR
ncbi:MAG: cysteine desulfurase family protein [Planctomycetota bacterium]